MTRHGIYWRPQGDLNPCRRRERADTNLTEVVDTKEVTKITQNVSTYLSTRAPNEAQATEVVTINTILQSIRNLNLEQQVALLMEILRGKGSGP